MKYACFVAISTGNQVSNLPPILDRAKAGDRVVWLESKEAKNRDWVKGANAVLKLRNIKTFRQPVEGDVNDPTNIADAFKYGLTQVGASHELCHKINIILNGGKKLSPIGIVLAVQELQTEQNLSAPIDYLYGDNSPSCLQVHEDDILSPMVQWEYDDQSSPSLDEIFQTKGYRAECNPSDVWRWGDTPVALPRYGSDKQYTGWLHGVWYKNQYNKGGIRKLSDWPPARRESWDKHIDGGEPWWLEGKNRWNIGSCFEDIVWQRVVYFLQKRESQLRSVVKECWKNVKIPDCIIDDQIAELDVVLVLTNGILIHLECKSHAVDFKDMDARIINLQRSAGNLAKMMIVTPMFPTFSEKQWFPEMHARYIRIQQWAMRGSSVIPYTLPEPPNFYQLPPNREGQSDSGPYPFSGSFESELDTLLKPYCL